MHRVVLEKPSIALKIANVFGVFGYLSLFVEWLWVFALIFYPFAKSVNFMLPSNTPVPHKAPTPLFTANSTLSLIIGGIVVVMCLALIIYSLYTVPRDVAKASSGATRSVANKIIPILIHHKPVSKQKTRRLTYVTINLLKLVAITVPLVAYAFAPGFPILTKPIIGVIAFFFACWALVWFGVQLAIVTLSHSDTTAAW